MKTLPRGREPPLWRFYAWSFVTSLGFFGPVLIVYLLDRGLSISEVFVLQSIYMLGILAMEVPTGYLADKWGRRNALALGNMLMALGFVCYYIGRSFMEFAIAESVLAMGMAMFSGTDSAILYDTLKNANMEREYKRIAGRTRLFASLGYGVASIMGGVIAGINLALPLIASIGSAIAGVMVSLLLPEPSRKRVEHSWTPMGIAMAIRRGIRDPKMFMLLMVMGLLVVVPLTGNKYLRQPYYLAVGIPLVWFGVLEATGALLRGTGSAMAHWLEKKTGKALGLAIPLVLMSVTTIGAGILAGPIGVLVLLSIEIPKGIYNPLFSDWINTVTRSSTRATVLSFQSMVTRLATGLSLPVMGIIAEAMGVRGALVVFGVFVLLGLVPVAVLARGLRRGLHSKGL